MTVRSVLYFQPTPQVVPRSACGVTNPTHTHVSHRDSANLRAASINTGNSSLFLIYTEFNFASLKISFRTTTCVAYEGKLLLLLFAFLAVVCDYSHCCCCCCYSGRGLVQTAMRLTRHQHCCFVWFSSITRGYYNLLYKKNIYIFHRNLLSKPLN